MKVPDYITQVLQKYQVDTIFGIVGIPIVELADTFIAHGIKFIGCRNEQSCSYAASAYGYLTGKPGILLTVGGPGVVHALAGIYNSMSNKWPLIVIAGSTEDPFKDGFQELNQISLMSSWCKFVGQLDIQNIDLIIYESMRNAINGKGVSYIDIPGKLINSEINQQIHKEFIEIPQLKCAPDEHILNQVAQLLKSTKQNVLLIIGKGSSIYSKELRGFINKYKFPFCPTPMAKGILPDSHNFNMNGCRSLALSTTDIVLTLGARLNWILHFGEAPRWKSGATFIQVDNDPLVLGKNSRHGYQVYSDIGLFIKALEKKLGEWEYHGQNISFLSKKIVENVNKLYLKETQVTTQLNYYNVYANMRKYINDSKTILITEGANTMDIARICFPTDFPKSRLDAGTNATMGVGLGYCIASKLAYPHKIVIGIIGDSAFGFSCAELETVSRNKLGIVIVIMNNGGIYRGRSSKDDPRSTDLTPECNYHLLGKGLGCNSAIVRNLNDLIYIFPKAISDSMKGIATVINVIIDPGIKEKLSFSWQNRSKI